MYKYFTITPEKQDNENVSSSFLAKPQTIRLLAKHKTVKMQLNRSKATQVFSKNRSLFNTKN